MNLSELLNMKIRKKEPEINLINIFARNTQTNNEKLISFLEIIDLLKTDTEAYKLYQLIWIYCTFGINRAEEYLCDFLENRNLNYHDLIVTKKTASNKYMNNAASLTKY